MMAYLENQNSNRLRSYEACPGLLKEHAGIEEPILANATHLHAHIGFSALYVTCRW